MENVFYLRLFIDAEKTRPACSGWVGNWPTSEAAEQAAGEVWPQLFATVKEGPPPHDWQKCPCKVCQGQREASNFYSVPCRFSP